MYCEHVGSNRHDKRTLLGAYFWYISIIHIQKLFEKKKAIIKTTNNTIATITFLSTFMALHIPQKQSTRSA